MTSLSGISGVGQAPPGTHENYVIPTGGISGTGYQNGVPITLTGEPGVRTPGDAYHPASQYQGIEGSWSTTFKELENVFDRIFAYRYGIALGLGLSGAVLCGALAYDEETRIKLIEGASHIAGASITTSGTIAVATINALGQAIDSFGEVIEQLMPGNILPEEVSLVG